MPRKESDLIPFVEPPVPKDIWRDFAPIYRVMSRLRNSGLNPTFVLSVGASTGVWSEAVHRVFGNARFILIDPLISGMRSVRNPLGPPSTRTLNPSKPQPQTKSVA